MLAYSGFQKRCVCTQPGVSVSDPGYWEKWVQKSVSFEEIIQEDVKGTSRGSNQLDRVT